MNEDKAAHPPILRGYEKEVCNQCLQIFTFLNAKLLGISNMYVVHFNEEFQKSPHDFDDFFFPIKDTQHFFSDSYESKFMHQGGKLGRRL